nr:DUF6491 family protein [Hyphomonas sp. Mor2]
MLTHRTALAVLLFAVSACATDTSPEAVAEREKERAEEVFANDVRRGAEIDRVCFARNIDSFGETTRSAVVVREGRDRYLVETFSGCFDLDWAQSLAIDSFSSCLTKGDRIFASDSAFGFDKQDLRQSCRVKAIYEWDPDAEEAKSEETDESESDSDADLETAALN